MQSQAWRPPGRSSRKRPACLRRSQHRPAAACLAVEGHVRDPVLEIGDEGWCEVGSGLLRVASLCVDGIAVNGGVSLVSRPVMRRQRRVLDRQGDQPERRHSVRAGDRLADVIDLGGRSRNCLRWRRSGRWTGGAGDRRRAIHTSGWLLRRGLERGADAGIELRAAVGQADDDFHALRVYGARGRRIGVDIFDLLIGHLAVAQQLDRIAPDGNDEVRIPSGRSSHAR